MIQYLAVLLLALRFGLEIYGASAIFLVPQGSLLYIVFMVVYLPRVCHTAQLVRCISNNSTAAKESYMPSTKIAPFTPRVATATTTAAVYYIE